MLAKQRSVHKGERLGNIWLNGNGMTEDRVRENNTAIKKKQFKTKAYTARLGSGFNNECQVSECYPSVDGEWMKIGEGVRT